MASQDLRDMLPLPIDACRPAKKPRLNSHRTTLKGLAREIQNLSGDSPIAIVPETSTLNKRRLSNRKPAARWRLEPFKNSARDDQSLILKHWRRNAEASSISNEEGLAVLAGSEIEDSTFAKFNVRIKVPKYDNHQYDTHLQSPDWSKDETDYLLRLVEEYDLRWPIIWDRYSYQSTKDSDPISSADDREIVCNTRVRVMEDLKERYYEVSAAMMQINLDKTSMTTHESNTLEYMLKFNKQQEITRKKFAEASFQRTIEEAREEENLLIELKRILARAEKLEYERQELYARLDAPPTTSPISAYTSSQGLQQLLASLVHADKVKRGKSLSGSVVSQTSSNQSNNNVETRRDSHVRDSIAGSNTGHKKLSSHGPSDHRTLTPQEETIFGVRHYDRIATTGPAFRHDKIMKQIIGKSAAQQTKISNILSELRIPPRLLMPTYRVGEAFESLQNDISLLLDLRKIADKLQGEINLLKLLKEEREKINYADHKEQCQDDTGDGLGTDKELAVEIASPFTEVSEKTS